MSKEINDLENFLGKKAQKKSRIISKETMKELIEKSNREVLLELSNIKTFKGRESFCIENLNEINVGSSRRIFDLRNGTALKLAKNGKGLEQNLNEMDGYLSFYPNIFTPTHKASEGGEWIIMDSGRVLKSEKDFEKNIEKKFGIDFELFKLLCQSSDQKLLGSPNAKTCLQENTLEKYKIVSRRNEDLFMEIYHKICEFSDYGDKNEDLFNFAEVLANTELMCGDLIRKNSWGFSSGEYKILDYGLNKDTYLNHYKKKTKNVLKY